MCLTFVLSYNYRKVILRTYNLEDKITSVNMGLQYTMFCLKMCEHATPNLYYSRIEKREENIQHYL